MIGQNPTISDNHYPLDLPLPSPCSPNLFVSWMRFVPYVPLVSKLEASFIFFFWQCQYGSGYSFIIDDKTAGIIPS